MDNYIKQIVAQGVFGRLDIDLELDPRINIIHAENGSGKTTLLHILANIMNGDFLRFAFITFSYIKVVFSSRNTIEISQSGADKDRTLNVKYNGKAIIKNVRLIDIQRSDRKVKRSPSSVRQLSLFDDLEVESEAIDWEPQEILSVSYFPAFRTMIEAWANVLGEEGSPLYRRDRARELAMLVEYEYEQRRRLGMSRYEGGRYQLLSTLEARRAFGEFVPSISYPSPTEIAENLNAQILKASLDIANKDRELLSQVFTDVFTALSQSQPDDLEDSQSILNEIQNMLSEDESTTSDQRATFMRGIRSNAFDSLKSAVNSITFDADKDVQKVAAPILNVYRSSLRERVKTQKATFQPIELYLNSVNDFLNDKEIIIHSYQSSAEPSIAIRFRNNAIEHGLRALSSGERQIVTLIYAATQMSMQEVVLIDEPEISLHIDWQRILLEKMLEQIGDRQIIICTHSPSIGANYLHNMIELKVRYTSSPEDISGANASQHDSTSSF